MTYQLKDEYIKLNSSNRLYSLNSPIIGLTGGIASGKSSVSKFLSQNGFFVICADSLVKHVYTSNITVTYMENSFPELINDGKINFIELRKVFFSDSLVQSEIEALIYSQLPDAFKAEVVKNKDHAPIIYDVPLLFEKGLDSLVDLKVCVYTSANNQISRLILRDSISEELAKNIISKQMNIEEKRKLSDYVIDNNDSKERLISNTQSFIDRFFLL